MIPETTALPGISCLVFFLPLPVARRIVSIVSFFPFRGCDVPPTLNHRDQNWLGIMRNTRASNANRRSYKWDVDCVVSLPIDSRGFNRCSRMLSSIKLRSVRSRYCIVQSVFVSFSLCLFEIERNPITFRRMKVSKGIGELCGSINPERDDSRRC